MATLLLRRGFRSVADPHVADLVIVNTCGFIEEAREEAREVLKELIASRPPHQRIVAAGCYAQYRPHELVQAVPDLDGVIGTRAWPDIADFVARLDMARPSLAEPIYHLLSVPALPLEGGPDGVRQVAIQGSSAYLKIAEGCSRRCAFCAIPGIRGPLRSRALPHVLDDARWLADQGVQEIILIAQDTTAYGRDLSSQTAGIVQLLDELVMVVPQVPWIRLMYVYPDPVMPSLAEAVARHPQVLPYFDLPLQHAHPRLLRRMDRPADVDAMRRLIEDIRALMPRAALRTTFLVGYPGETEEEFDALLDFVQDVAFDRLGVFTYSHETETPAAGLADDVPVSVKEKRREMLMATQQPISLAHNERFVGEVLDVLIEGQGEGLSVGRSYRDAPEIDGLVLVEGDLSPGAIVPVRIESALVYDLVGVPA